MLFFYFVVFIFNSGQLAGLRYAFYATDSADQSMSQTKKPNIFPQMALKLSSTIFM